MLLLDKDVALESCGRYFYFAGNYRKKRCAKFYYAVKDSIANLFITFLVAKLFYKDGFGCGGTIFKIIYW